MDEYMGAQNHGVGAEPQALWERDKMNLAGGLKLHGHWDDSSPAACGNSCPSRDFLKVGVSLMTSAIFFPFLVWGGFVFLPFDAPLLDGVPLKMIYALRCSVFASTPIVLGWLAVGVARFRFGVVRPLLDEMEVTADLEEINVHRNYTRESVSLFLMYLLQLVVMAIYLSQEQLKLVPLFAIIFALGRLIYWVAAAFGSSIRAFGLGMSLLPCLVMMMANLVFIFTAESPSMWSSPQRPVVAISQQRFWG
ncbi:transmembrane protein 79-like [Hippocampus zosterae]|uniref:transmembrane protein 79-like n=1 Tax=Hippocampus zosterae TaxID=109293 RepID=UPI00223E2788|nr:transmembrane protein 79-like [Hippocampus zosterae]XP_051921640.1 transmembrane protein 79-like [Hippocampus zosterae]